MKHSIWRFLYRATLCSSFLAGGFEFAEAQSPEIGCTGPLPDSIVVMIRLVHGDRPIQREVLQGVPQVSGRNAPAPGTIIRVYSDPFDLVGDFDTDGIADTVRALTEVSGPGGMDPCPGGPNGGGCTQGERVIQAPFKNSSEEWSLPAVYVNPQSGGVLVRSEGNIGDWTPTTFEIRFTDDHEGSFAYHAFTTERVVRYPLEIWDIGTVPLGAPNDPSDDRRMAVVAFSDALGECTFGYDEVQVAAETWISDRIYAYHFAEGFTHDDYHSAVTQYVSDSPFDILEPLVGQRRDCVGGKVSRFECSGIDLLAFLPNTFFGVSTVRDVWGWTDSQTGREYALVATQRGMFFFDISVPTNPTFMGWLPGPGNTGASDIKVFADYAFAVADNTGAGMHVFDLTRLRDVTTTPVQFSSTRLRSPFDRIHNIFINEATGFLYTSLASTCCCTGIEIYDIQDPANPSVAGCISNADAHDVQCVNYAGPDPDHVGAEMCFLSMEDRGFGIADVSNKLEPALVAQESYPDISYSSSGWLTEDHRYFLMTDELDELNLSLNTRTIVWDVRDLDTPEILTTYEGPTKATDHSLYILGDYVYEANGHSGLRVLDIADIEAPREVAFFDTYPLDNDSGLYEGAWAVFPFSSNGVVVVTSMTEGLFVLQLADDVSAENVNRIPRGFRLNQNYPNPFNPTTTISYALPAAADVTLTVVDVLGRQIRELASGTKPAGDYEVSFDAEELPSGIYFYRLEAGDYVETKRMVVVK